MKRQPFILLAGLTLLALGAARAVNTDSVEHDSYAEFSQGEFENVSLTSEGRLTLAPAITNLATTADPIIWCAVQDEHGNVFLGTGNQGKVYKLTPKGELSVFFAPNEVMVHALALDGKGRLYAATSPNGRVYRLEADGKAEVYCNPGENYIWAMSFGKDESLFLATGNRGKILRVPPGGGPKAKVETYFDTGETHISALAADKDGNLFAGTSPHGYVYRIDKANHGFVLFDSSETEVKQIAVAADGTIYASTFAGSSRSESPSGPLPMPMMGPNPPGDEGSNPDDDASSGPDKSAMPSNLPPSGPAPTDEGPPGEPPVMMMGSRGRPSSGGAGSGGGPSQGAIYRIDASGFHERYWGAPGEAIHAMTLLKDGNLLVGTGGKGRIYKVSGPNRWMLLQETGAGAQVSALLSGAAQEYFAATSHPGKLYRLDFNLATNGTYTSKAFDAKQKSAWGKIRPTAEVPAGAGLEFSTRSGNTEKPEKTWSDWSGVSSLKPELSVTSPPARYLQYRVAFKREAKSPSVTAGLDRVRFFYQNHNAAPVIPRIKVHTSGFGFSKMTMPPMDMPVNPDQLLNAGGEGNSGGMMNPRSSLKMTRSPGLRTVFWSASDPNQDQLVYSVAIRAEAETQWTVLAEKTEETFLSFDTTGYREGTYFIKVTASDKLSNTPATARTTEEISPAFLINNQPPVLTVKTQAVDKDRAQISVEAVNNASVISAASYALDGREEVALRPDDLLFDSTTETFSIDLVNLEKGAHSVLVRVQNEAKNASVLKLNFEVK